ncbi:hypothetical protein [Cupriavidus sp. TMH.W2]|uniref:ADP-ribosyltransferase-containing protein n=1 Tax=Cupriavidus sp. TMH.W2 TaxID=3434465 RepID=UPI003D788B80
MPPATVPVAAVDADVAALSGAAGPAGPGSAAFAAWFAGSRIVADGVPLICYHGTAADFSVFVAHAPVTVYRLDGAALDRVDSWDVAGDWSRRPEAFHYGALADAVQLGAEAALAMREREAHAMATYRRAQGEATPAADDPADDTVRRLTDLRRLLGRALVQTTEVRPSGDGHYFTPDPSYSFIRDIGQRDAGRVVPVYLAIRNPVYLNAAQIESAGSAHWVAHYRALGHDGAIFSDHADLRRRGWNGATQIVAFDAHQIKSVFNVGTYDPANPDIRFRRDGAQPLPAPAVGTPTAVAPNPFALPPGLGSEALARHGLAMSAAQREAAFSAWFKDSHVRHADGTPRICYHGSTADFAVFRPHRGTDADPGWYGSGIYLTADPATASAYAGELVETGAGEEAGAPRVIAAYVSLQHPYVWPADRAAATTPEQARAIRAELEAAGYDGVVVGNAYADPELAAHWEVVAFHPAQVKSVYNVGTFDATVDDIRFARTRAKLADRRARLDKPTLTDAQAVPAIVYHLSPREHRAQILAQGLRVAADRTGMAAVFVSDTASAGGAGFDVYAIATQGLDFEPDATTEPIAGERWFATYDDIPVQALRLAPELATPGADADASAALVTCRTAVRPPRKEGALRDAAFDAWFAGSKIVDATGAPLVLYHGTKSDFDRYDIKTFGASDEGLAGKGFYFTYNPEEASSYAINEQYGKGDAPNVQPVYVSLNNPFVIQQGRLPDGRKLQELHKGIGVTASGGSAVRNMAEEAGHDGIVWTNRDGHILHVVAWRPEQIKSAIGNAGTYDADNPDIRFARTASAALAPTAERPEGPFAQWFADSVVRDADGVPMVVFHGSRASFSTFALDQAMTAGRVESEYGRACYFTPDPDAAAAYATTAQQPGGEVVYPVYLLMRRPYVIDLTKVAVRAQYAPGHDPAFLARLQARGYDGIVVVDEDVDGRPPIDPLRDLPAFATELIVFDPAQILSAIADIDPLDLSHPGHRRRAALARYFEGASQKTVPPQQRSAPAPRPSAPDQGAYEP